MVEGGSREGTDMRTMSVLFRSDCSKEDIEGVEKGVCGGQRTFNFVTAASEFLQWGSVRHGGLQSAGFRGARKHITLASGLASRGPVQFLYTTPRGFVFVHFSM